MPIAKIIVELEIPDAHSLKDRRRVLRSVRDRLRHGFNVSVAELDEGLAWNRATLGLVTISKSSGYLAGQCTALEGILHSFSAQMGAQITDIYAEILDE